MVKVKPGHWRSKANVWDVIHWDSAMRGFLALERVIKFWTDISIRIASVNIIFFLSTFCSVYFLVRTYILCVKISGRYYVLNALKCSLVAMYMWLYDNSISLFGLSMQWCCIHEIYLALFHPFLKIWSYTCVMYSSHQYCFNGGYYYLGAVMYGLWIWHSLFKPFSFWIIA